MDIHTGSKTYNTKYGGHNSDFPILPITLFSLQPPSVLYPQLLATLDLKFFADTGTPSGKKSGCDISYG
jgi:hypothetical protein